ncbi:hypothetical protein BKA70DRAFT_1417268 [Coprinopsis sp. MPI-PUGE-AT-0042]|nr:hypothetical protein BKA70DRAFT_1417268 [Coprinopsis sp. MPI-PUGE-AT-0042]
MGDVEQMAHLAGVVRRLREVSYVDVAALTYILADYAQTFEWEVKYMWGGKRSLIKLVYFVGRYLGVLDFPLMFVYSHHVGKLTPKDCHILYTIGGFSALTGATAGEVLMFLRVWVLSGCTKKMGWYLTVQFTLSLTAIVVLAGFYLDSLVFTTSPLPNHISCFQLSGDRFKLALMYSFVLIHQFAVMMLSLYFGVASFRHSKSPLLLILYRDGTLYFATLSLISIANIAVITAGPPEYQNLFLLLQRTAHSTLSTRTILKMREMASRDVYIPTTPGDGDVGQVLQPHNQNGMRFPGSLQFRSRAQEFISEGLVFSRTMLASMDEREETGGAVEGGERSFGLATRRGDQDETVNK